MVAVFKTERDQDKPEEEAGPFLSERSSDTPKPGPEPVVFKEQRPSAASNIDIGNVEEPGWLGRAFDSFQEWREGTKPERKFSREEAKEITKRLIKQNRELFPNKGFGQFSFGDVKPAPHSALVRAGLEPPPEDEAENALNDYIRTDPDRPAKATPEGRIKAEQERWRTFPEDPAGFKIDPTRPIWRQESGQPSTEVSITIEMDGRFYNIPTIVDGRPVSQGMAIVDAKKQAAKGWMFPNFATMDQALAAAPARSDAIMPARQEWAAREKEEPEAREPIERDEDKPEDPFWGRGGTVLWDTLTNVPAMFKRQYGGAKMFLNAPRDLAYILESASDQGVAPEDSFALEVEAYVQGKEPAEVYGGMLKSAEQNVGLQEGLRMSKEAKDYLETYRPNVREDSVKYYASAIIEGTINMAPMVVVAGLTRSPTAGAAIMGGQVFADQYAASIEEGRSHSEAVMDGTVFAAAEVLTERIPLGILTSEGGTLLKRMFKAGGAEGLQEPLTQLLQEGYTKAIINDEMTLGEALLEIVTTKEGLQMLKRSAIIGIGVGGTLASMTHPLYKDVTQEDVNDVDPDAGKKPKKPKPTIPSEDSTKISDAEAESMGLSKVEVTQDVLERVGAGQPLSIDEQYTLTNDNWGKFFGPDDRIMMLPKGKRELAKLRKESIELGERVEEVTMEGEEVTTRIIEAGEVVEEDEAPRRAQRPQARLEDAQEGDSLTVYDPKGGTVEVTVVGISPETGAVLVERPDGSQTVVNQDELSSISVEDSAYPVDESGVVDLQGKVVGELTEEEMDIAWDVTDRKFQAHKNEGKLGTPGGLSLLRMRNALRLEQKRREAGPSAFVEERPSVSKGEVFKIGEPVARNEAKQRLAAAERRAERPTEEQKKAGNYKKGHVRIDALPVTIETPRSKTRSGEDSEGKKWSMRMKDAYGYIKGTESREEDGRGGFDQIDAFIGRYPGSGQVLVINQKKDASKPMSPDNFDEHKVMLGYRTTEEAIKAYNRNYEDGGKLRGDHVEMTTKEFRKWLDSADTKYPAGMSRLETDQETVLKHRRMNTNHGRGQSVESVQAALRPIYKWFRSVPPVRVVEAVEDLPRHLQTALDDDHSKKNTTGMYDQGSFNDDIYIIANNVTDTAEAIETMLHEVVGHFGLRQVIAPWKFDETMDMVAKSFPKQVREITQTYDLDWNNIDERRIAAEEYIAHTAQRVLAGQTVTDKAKALLDRIVQALRDVVRWATGQETLYSSGQIMSMIAQSSDFVQKPGGYKRTKRRGRLRHVSAPYFYSAAWKAFNDSDTKSTSAEGWKQFIKSQIKKGKMKQVELDWMGLDTFLDDATWNDLYKLSSFSTYGDKIEDVRAVFPATMFEVYKEQRELGADNQATIKRAQELQYEAFEIAHPNIAKKASGPGYDGTASDFRRTWLDAPENDMIQFLPVNEQRDLANKQERHKELTNQLEAFGQEKPKKISKDSVMAFIERNGVDIDVREPGGSDEYGEPYFDESNPDDSEDPDEDNWYEAWDNVRDEHWEGYYTNALVSVFQEHNWDPDLEADPDVPEEEDMDIEELNEALGAWDGTSVDDMEEQANEEATDSLEGDYYHEARSDWEEKYTNRTWYGGGWTIRQYEGSFYLSDNEGNDHGTHDSFDDAVNAADDAYQETTQAWKDYMVAPAGDDYGVLLFRWQNPESNIFEETGHWANDDNFVAHVRFDTRKDPDGNDAYYIDELQSDWHQAIRDSVQSALEGVWDSHNYDPEYENADGTFGGGEFYDNAPLAAMYEEARGLALENPEEVKKWKDQAQSQFKIIEQYKESVVEEMKEWPMNRNMATILRSALMGEEGVSAAKDILGGFDSKVKSKEAAAVATETDRKDQIRSFVYEEHGFLVGLNEVQNILFSAYRELRQGEPGAQFKADLISEEEFNYMVEKRAKELGITVQQFDRERMGEWREWAADIWSGEKFQNRIAQHVLKELAASSITEVPEWDGTTIKEMDTDVEKQAVGQLHDEAMNRPLKDLPTAVNAWQKVMDGTHAKEAWQENVDVLANASYGWETHQAMNLYSAFARLSKEMHKLSARTQGEAEVGYVPWQEEDMGFPQFTYIMNEKQVKQFEHGILTFNEAKNKYQQYSDGHSFAPFEKDWQLLVMKHMIADAARKGHKHIYFSKGEVHGVRWSGAEAVSGLEFKKHPIPEPEANPTPDLFTGEIMRPKLGNEFVIELRPSGTGRIIKTNNKQLRKNVGDRVAKAILESKSAEGTVNALDVDQRNVLVPSAGGGTRLTGSRMIYNEVAVNMVNKFLKKFKAKAVHAYVPATAGPGRAAAAVREQTEREGLHTRGEPGTDFDKWQRSRIRKLSGIEVTTQVEGGFDSVMYRSGEDIEDPANRGVWIIEVPNEEGIFTRASDFWPGRVHAEAMLFKLQRRHGDKAWGYEAWDIEITPKLVEAAKEGFPLFHKRGKPKTGDSALDKALEWANKNIGPQGPRSLERLQERVNEVLRVENKQAKMEQALIDQFAGLKWAIRQTHDHELPAEVSAYKQAHFTTSMDSQMFVFLTHGVPYWEKVGAGTITGIKPGTQGLLEVLEPVTDKIKEWGYWMAARRANRLMKEGREALFTQERIDELLKLGDMFPEFQDVADAYNDWKTQFLDWAEEAGVINSETRPLWDQADYVPFYRIKSDEMGGSFAKRAGMGGPGIANVTQPIKRLMGSKHPLGDILENIIVNFQHIATTTMKNKAAQLAIENLEQSGLISKVPPQEFMKQEFIPLDELKKQLKQAGVDWEAMSTEALAGMQKMWTLQRPEGDDVISVLYDGKKKYFKVHEETLLRSLTAINEKKFASIWGRMGMWLPRKFKRLGTSMITLTPGFMAANWFRDLFMAFTNSRHAKMPKPFSGVTGAWKAFTKSPEMVSMMAAGGAFYSGYINANDPVSTVKAMKRALRQTGFKNRILDAPWKLFHFYNDIGAASENANRIGSAYVPAIKAGVGKAEAVWEAKDLMNFAKHGDHAAMQFFAQSVMFLNARIQGLVRYSQRFAEAPGVTTMKSMLYAMAVLAMWLKNKDDDRYKALPEEEKDMYVHVWVNGNHWRLPKAFEVGMVFGVGVERMFEYFYSNEDDAGKVAIDRLWFVFGEVFNFFNRETIVPLPQFIGPLFEATNNWNAFFQAPIVPEYMQDIAEVKPEIVYRPQTSPTARELAAGMPKFAPATLRNPLLLEHLVRGYLGTLGGYVMMMSDDLVRKSFDYPARPALRWQKIPLAGRFYRGDEPPSRSNFEEIMYEVRNNARQIERAVNQMERLEMDNEVETFLEAGSKYDRDFTNQEVLDAASSMESSYQQIRKLRKETNDLWEDENMTPEEKLRELNNIYRDKLNLSKDAWMERPGATIQFQALQDTLIDMIPGERIDFLAEEGLDKTADLLANLPKKPHNRMRKIIWENSA